LNATDEDSISPGDGFCSFCTKNFCQDTGEQPNPITTAVPFLLIAPDARSGGMGDFGASSTPDAYSMYGIRQNMHLLIKILVQQSVMYPGFAAW